MAIGVGSRVKVSSYPKPEIVGLVGKITAIRNSFVAAELTGDTISERLFRIGELIELTEPLKIEPLPFALGDFAEVPASENHVWAGIGKVVAVYPSLGNVALDMLTGKRTGSRGGFDVKELIPASYPPATATSINPNLGLQAGRRGDLQAGAVVCRRSLTSIYPPPGSVLAAKGINGAIASHSKVFSTAKQIAINLSKTNPYVNADMVQSELKKLGLTSADLGNAAGGLFRGKKWQFLGYTSSNRTSNHARTIKSWKYVG